MALQPGFNTPPPNLEVKIHLLMWNRHTHTHRGKEGVKKAKGVTGIPFVVTYHPQLKNLGRIINQNIYLLNMNEETKKVFSP